MIKENEKFKVCKSENYNYVFDKTTGEFYRWGATEKDDPDYSPIGPEIADIELSTICHQGCRECYKSLTHNGLNMSIDTYKRLFANLGNNLQQIAFGVGDLQDCVDLEAILKHTRDNGVIPNITINGFRMTDYYYDMLVKYCGAVAVSCYDYDVCFNAIHELHKRGLKFINIHQIVSRETLDKCYELVRRKSENNDERLKGLQAIVFLWLKPKGDRNTSSQVSQDEFNALVRYAMNLNVSIGFDSCSAPMFAKAVNYDPNIMQYVESCESTLFSAYINVEGKFFPCSFSENVGIYSGIDLTGDVNIMDIWNSHPQILKFREDSLKSVCNGCRNCTIYKLGDKII